MKLDHREEMTQALQQAKEAVVDAGLARRNITIHHDIFIINDKLWPIIVAVNITNEAGHQEFDMTLSMTKCGLGEYMASESGAVARSEYVAPSTALLLIDSLLSVLDQL